jgi:hypothetical protein
LAASAWQNKHKFHSSDGSLGGGDEERGLERTFTNEELHVSARGNSNNVSKALGGDAFGGGRELVVRHG